MINETENNRKAAMLWAQVEKSDPFAYGRMKLHLDNGLHDTKEAPGYANVGMQALTILQARGEIPCI